MRLVVSIDEYRVAEAPSVNASAQDKIWRATAIRTPARAKARNRWRRSVKAARPTPETASTRPKVTYIDTAGKETTLDIAEGTSVMQAAVLNGIDGITAECGGSCMCATCHVYVRDDQIAKTPPMQPDEDAMLEGTASERRPNSRLSCQLVVSPEMDGLVVCLPETQT